MRHLWLVVCVACGDNRAWVAAPDVPHDSGGDSSTASDASVSPADAPAVDPIITLPESRSGTRLKLIWTVFDGARSFIGYHDAQRDELCTEQRWADGQRYCTPTADGRYEMFSDPGCTDARVHGGIDHNRYFVLHPAPAYLPSKMYEYGAPDLVTQRAYHKRDGQCIGPFASGPLVHIGAEVPVTQLVRLAVSDPEGAGRVKVRYLRSEDGLQHPFVLHDSVLATDCYANELGNECTPANTANARVFSDPACTKRAARRDDVGSGVPTFLSTFSSDCVDRTASFFRRGNSLTGFAYELVAGVCVPSASPTELLELGDPVDVARAQHVHIPSSGRFQATAAAFDGVTWPFPRRHFDSALGEVCWAERAEDGRVRCLPNAGTYAAAFFTDSRCEQPPIEVVQAYRPSGCPLVSPSFALAIRDRRIVRVGARLDVPVYNDFAGCRADPFDALFENYLVGESVPVETFGLGTGVVEP